MARQIIKAARRHGDTTMPSAANIIHNLYRWERGDNGISERYRLYCSELLDTPPARPGRGAAFVLSPTASSITGAMIPVDGGAIRSF